MVHIEVPILCTHLVLVCISKAYFIIVTKQQAASLHTIAQGDKQADGEAAEHSNSLEITVLQEPHFPAANGMFMLACVFTRRVCTGVAQPNVKALIKCSKGL